MSAGAAGAGATGAGRSGAGDPAGKRERRAARSEEHLRRDALACLEAGLADADAEALTIAALAREGSLWPAAREILLAGFGKAALAMARGALRVCGERIAAGLILVPHGFTGAPPRGVRVVTGAHPLPDPAAVAGARELRALVERAAQRRLPLLCLVSGGGSSLLTLPPDDVALEEIRAVTARLLEAGAGIAEVNCVRKHLDRLKGGQLARLAAPAPVLGLILSDVIGDPLDAIASGPLSPDPTDFARAIDVLRRHDLWGCAPRAVRDHLEAGRMGRIADTPASGDPDLRHVRTILIGNGRTAAEAARREAERRGYRARVVSPELEGEARAAGGNLGRQARALLNEAGPALAMVSTGETTVTVRGPGRGGRNQELALAAALAVEGCPGIVIASLGTDGIDGPTDAAGAVATGTSVPRALALGLDPRALLAANDSYRFFAALGDHIKTGPTGTNVMDLQIVLVDAGQVEAS
jgi:glycerate 2-kinase